MRKTIPTDWAARNPIKQSAETVINDTFITYRGCLITREGLKFTRNNGKSYDSLKEAKDAIDNGLLALQNSIR